MSKMITYLLLASVLIDACSSVQAQPASADPAAENCLKQGGEIQIRQRGNGWDYEICAFDDGRQCEAWAMMRGDCPAGGVEVADYHTSAARYCAITGGEYHLISKAGAEDEKGTCNFTCGKSCDVWAYYSGRCGACVGK
jgi:putative hemolysin